MTQPTPSTLIATGYSQQVHRTTKSTTSRTDKKPKRYIKCATTLNPGKDRLRLGERQVLSSDTKAEPRTSLCTHCFVWNGRPSAALGILFRISHHRAMLEAS
uniref:Uncharacterized protein n=1 Tax=Anguilla anguilla TaxID=7936 RepID=A0A0E9QQJ0_ANGAN